MFLGHLRTFERFANQRNFSFLLQLSNRTTLANNFGLLPFLTRMEERRQFSSSSDDQKNKKEIKLLTAQERLMANRLKVSSFRLFLPFTSYGIFSFISPFNMVKYSFSWLSNFREYFTLIARMAFQAVRPLLAFCVMGEAVKVALAMISGKSTAFLFSFVLAFEVFYFFLQCYISGVFLSMFFKALI